MIVGIFVGGRSSRMGFAPKGLMRAPDTGEALVVRTARLCTELSLQPVLVGPAEPYAAVLPELARLPDDPAGVGPLGGLSAVLKAAAGGAALAIACDMPHITIPLLVKLRDAHGALVAARGALGFWEPFFARYESGRVLPVLDSVLDGGMRSFQQLFAHITPDELALSAEEKALLADWDSPEDLPQHSKDRFR